MKVLRGAWQNLAIAVAAGASLAAVWLTRDLSAPPQNAGQTSLLSEFASQEATRIDFTKQGQHWAIERRGGDAGTASFMLVNPVRELADAASVDKFLSALANAHSLRPVDSGETLHAFGLDQPRSQSSVRTEKHTYRVAIGGSAPTPTGARYVAASRDQERPRVVVVAKSVIDDLDVDLDAFRERSLVPLDESDVTRIAIASPKLNLTLQRSTGLGFVVLGPTKQRCDRDTLKSLFFQLSRLSATRFLSGAEATRALGQESAHLELDSKNPDQRLSFEVGGSCPGDASQLVVIRHGETAGYACAPREIEATLRLAASDFVDRHAFSLRSDEVEELDIRGGKTKFLLRRKGSGFVLTTGGEARPETENEVELEAGNQRISALLEAEGERVEPAKLADLGLEPATSTVTLRSSAARDSDVVQQIVRVGKTDPGRGLYVYREQDSTVLRIPPEHARAFAVDSTLLYARKLTEFGLSSFVSADISRPRGRELLRRGADQELHLDYPPGFDPDGVLSSDLIQALGALTAERFVADRDDGSFGLDQTRLSVNFAFKNSEGKTVERKLRVGNETSLGVFAALDEGGPVFVVPRSVRDTCDTLLINRAVIPSAPETLSSFSLEASGHTLRFERKGDQFLPVPSTGFAQERVPDVLEALSNLRPEAGIHTGSALPSEGFGSPTLTLRFASKSGTNQIVSFGAGDSWRQTSIFYVRVSGIDATFVMAQSKVMALRDAL